MYQPGTTMVANPAHGRRNKENIFPLSPFTPEDLRLANRVYPSPPAPVRLFSITIKLNLVLTHEISPAFDDGVRIIYRQPRPGKCRV